MLICCVSMFCVCVRACFKHNNKTHTHIYRHSLTHTHAYAFAKRQNKLTTIAIVFGLYSFALSAALNK